MFQVLTGGEAPVRPLPPARQSEEKESFTGRLVLNWGMKASPKEGDPMRTRVSTETNFVLVTLRRHDSHLVECIDLKGWFL